MRLYVVSPLPRTSGNQSQNKVVCEQHRIERLDDGWHQRGIIRPEDCDGCDYCEAR